MPVPALLNLNLQIQTHRFLLNFHQMKCVLMLFYYLHQIFRFQPDSCGILVWVDTDQSWLIQKCPVKENLNSVFIVIQNSERRYGAGNKSHNRP